MSKFFGIEIIWKKREKTPLYLKSLLDLSKEKKDLHVYNIKTMKIKKSRHIKEFDLKNLLLKRTLIFTYIQATSIKEVGQQ